MHKFSDFSEEKAVLEGEKVQVAEIIGKVIVVTDFRTMPSKISHTGIVMQLQFEDGGRKHVVFTSSQVLIRQAEKYKEQMPFEATIKRIKQYLTFA